MPIIEVNHVTKEYQLGQIESLKITALNQWRRVTGQPVDERDPFKALDGVTLSVEQGEVLGIISYNGAGKSTLPKMLTFVARLQRRLGDPYNCLRDNYAPSSLTSIIKGKASVPILSVFFGIIVRMWHDDHPPPHIHVEYQNFEALMKIQTTM